MAARKPFDVTAWEFFWTLVAMFLMGGLASWGLFGAPRLIDKAAASGPADWITAIGTWVIGYGAVRFARNAHRLREREIEEERLQRLRDRNIARNNMFNRLLPIGTFGLQLKPAIENGAEMTVPQIVFIVKRAIEDAEFESSPSDDKIVNRKAQAALARIYASLKKFKRLGDLVIFSLEDGDAGRVGVDDTESGLLRDMEATAEEVKVQFDYLAAFLKSSREKDPETAETSTGSRRDSPRDN